MPQNNTPTIPRLHFRVAMFILGLALVACQPAASQSTTRTPATPSPTATLTPAELTGKPLKGSTGAVYRLMENGELRHIRDWATYLALGFDPTGILQLSDEQLAAYPIGLPLTRYLTGEQDRRLYFIHQTQRYRINDAAMLQMMGGTARDVVRVPDEYLASFPLATTTLTVTASYIPPPAAITAATWANGGLWVASAAGGLRVWQAGTWIAVPVPDSTIIRALAVEPPWIYAASDTGVIWQLANDKAPVRVADTGLHWISALVAVADGSLWAADANFYDFAAGRFHRGRGLVRIGRDGQVETISDDEALQNVASMEFDSATHTLWLATRHAGLLRYDLAGQFWQQFTELNSTLPDHILYDLALDAAGTLWLASPVGIVSFRDSTFTTHATGVPLALAVATDGALWFAGDNLIGKLGTVQYPLFDHPALQDPFVAVVLDDEDRPWFIRRRNVVHFNGTQWLTLDLDDGQTAAITPGEPHLTPVPDFPAPLTDYNAWLQTWPRPPADNGRCIHYLRHPAGDDFETWYQIGRLEQLGVRWVLVNYIWHSQLAQLAPIFAQTDIMVIWRPFLRPYEVYSDWGADVTLLRALGLPPYMQIYNEPNLPEEWDGRPVDQELYLASLLPAIEQVYAAGGYVGLQEFDLEWTRTALQRLKAANMDYVFDRLFFIAHAYGANHPPDFTEDIHGVLAAEMGFVPMMIAGEGGWHVGNQADTRYPVVTEEHHRNFHLAVFDWFRSGRLSDDTPLPDYFFAFCPWLLADPNDPYAWFDGATGARTLTIEAVGGMEAFERQFSWQERGAE